MRFSLVDRIIELERAKKITAIRAVTIAEEYLGDHFPTFPVLPGVLMLQALVESASWLVRDALDFVPGLVLLKSAKNVTYKSFVKPGHVLRVEVTCRRLESAESDFEGVGCCESVEVVKGRFSLRHTTLGDSLPIDETARQRMIQDAKTRFGLIRR